ncbi:hypothetical protein HanIR_Chr17g0888271 [Helianthus annuus]|nr:hypothetical protein HanIR_Chr17g0888271 [Helianthus annuus]
MSDLRGHVAIEARSTLPATRDRGGRPVRDTRGKPKFGYISSSLGLEFLHQFDRISTNLLSRISVSLHNTPKTPKFCSLLG